MVGLWSGAATTVEKFMSLNSDPKGYNDKRWGQNGPAVNLYSTHSEEGIVMPSCAVIRKVGHRIKWTLTMINGKHEEGTNNGCSCLTGLELSFQERLSHSMHPECVLEHAGWQLCDWVYFLQHSFYTVVIYTSREHLDMSSHKRVFFMFAIFYYFRIIMNTLPLSNKTELLESDICVMN